MTPRKFPARVSRCDNSARESYLNEDARRYVNDRTGTGAAIAAEQRQRDAMVEESIASSRETSAATRREREEAMAKIAEQREAAIAEDRKRAAAAAKQLKESAKFW